MRVELNGIDVSALLDRAERATAPSPELVAEIDHALHVTSSSSIKWKGRDPLAELRAQRTRLATQPD